MKKTLISSIIALTSLALVGCGNSGESAVDGESITVAIGNAYAPFTYLDEAGEPAGYDVEVLKAVDEKLDEYTFEYEPMEFKTILTSLDAGQARIGAHQFEKNGERENSYLFGEESYTEYRTHIATAADSDFNPQTLDDLVGKTVVVAQGTNFSTTLERYNSENEGQIDIKFVEMNMDIITNELTSGAADATLFTTYDINAVNTNYGDIVKSSDEPVYVTDSYFVFKQGDTEIQEAVDQAVTELKEEGYLEQLEDEIIIAE